MFRSVGRSSGIIYLVASVVVGVITFAGPVRLAEPGRGDAPFVAILAAHLAWGLVLLFTSFATRGFSRPAVRRLFLVPEVLAAAGLLWFLFAFIFAINANMDYVQRFIQSGGNLRLALDTRTERLLVWIRYFPLVAVDLGLYLLYRIGRYRSVVAAVNDPTRPRDMLVRPWALVLTLLSALLSSIAMPSFLSLRGMPILGWIAMVPLFLVLRRERLGRATFYTAVYGIFTTLLSNYWLGTFNLVSLQIIVVVFLVYYLVFAPAAVLLHHLARWARVLVFPLAWTLLEYLRSIGFLGYPWALAAHSQYAFLPIIQVAALTGVWGVSFLVYFANSALAEFLGSLVERLSRPRGQGGENRVTSLSVSFAWLASAVVVVAGVALAGTYALALGARGSGETTEVRIAQIQQNSDPRKHLYEDTLDALIRLTDSTLPESPDLVVWPETAFVPNIRRWSTDTSSRRYHRLVTEFLEYQRGMGTWLVTGNDDYEVLLGEDGEVIDRLEYNAAILFAPDGTRVETYRKIQLVPFTESFPFEEQLPGIYQLLQDYDVHFWEPGQEYTVFRHPKIDFSTPICYEDVFPDYVRRYALRGADAILNISNDYWSLTEVQAKQHFVAGLFRAVENRRPVIRTTVSGLTGQIDRFGRILQTAGYYQEGTLISRVPVPADPPFTLYTRWGDYFPIAAGGALAVLAGLSLLLPVRTGTPVGWGTSSRSSGAAGSAPAGRARRSRKDRGRAVDEEGIFVTPRYPNGRPEERGAPADRPKGSRIDTTPSQTAQTPAEEAARTPRKPGQAAPEPSPDAVAEESPTAGAVYADARRAGSVQEDEPVARPAEQVGPAEPAAEDDRASRKKRAAARKKRRRHRTNWKVIWDD